MIVIPDLHGNYRKLERILTKFPDEKFIGLGDYVDSYDLPTDFQYRTLFKVIDLIKEGRMVALLGNHELQYLDNPPFYCTGYNTSAAFNFNKILMNNIHLFNAAIYVDGYIATHGGIHERLEISDDPTIQTEFLEECWEDYLYNGKDEDEIFNMSPGRSKITLSTYGGIFWFDCKRDYGVSTKYNQIVGHTADYVPYKETFENGNTFHCLCTYDDLKDIYVFDTKSKTVIKI